MDFEAYYKIVIFIIFGEYLSHGVHSCVEHHTNLWVVQSRVNRNILKPIIEKEGFQILKEMHEMPGLYSLINKNRQRCNKHENQILIHRLSQHKEILWADRVPMKKLTLMSATCPGQYNKNQSAYNKLFRDQYFSNQWYLHDCRSHDNFPIIDMNVIQVWYKYKYFGKGIFVAICDDTIDETHEDLIDNFDKSLSLNLFDEDDTPQKHGTIIAGALGMRAGNKHCGVGIAPLVTFGTVIMFNQGMMISSLKTLEGFNFSKNKFDIVLCAWGPKSDGEEFGYLDDFTMAAFKQGIIEGRGKRGIIYIFPAGNGGINNDNCSYDEYANQMYTIAVGGINHYGYPTSLTEPCSALLLSTYSGDTADPSPINLTSTVPLNACSVGDIAGTSLTVPLIGGIAALILEANPNLTWRGVQHIFVWTSEIAAIANNSNWKRNKIGLFYHPYFGFGNANALAAVELAIIMKSHYLPPMNSCTFRLKIRNPLKFNQSNSLKLLVKSIGCSNLPSAVNYIEHTQLIISMKYWRRGNLEILLTSPSGTESQLLYHRSNDQSDAGFKKWTFDSTHFWGENPIGTWIISIIGSGRPSSPSQNSGEVSYACLVFNGTKVKPAHYLLPRWYYKPKRPESTTVNEEVDKMMSTDSLSITSPDSKINEAMETSVLSVTSESEKQNLIRSHPHKSSSTSNVISWFGKVLRSIFCLG